jgi:glycerol kinase
MQANRQYILSIDQGTSSTKTLIFDEQGEAVAKGNEPLFTQYLPDGHVEQDPELIIQNVLASVQKCLADFTQKGGTVKEIRGIGISNQRETFVLWDEAGKPLYNAVVWQCKRSVAVCERLKQLPVATTLREKTGLLVDPYFSGTKLIWLYEQVPAIKKAIDEGKAFFGTIDSWLLYKFTNGKSYYTDYTNASRTLFFNLHTLDWDQDLLADFHLGGLRLPGCRPSSCSFGETDLMGLLEQPVTISGMIGDSHAAAFGQGCFEPGTAKATLGTGCSVLMNTGSKLTASTAGMVTTICWSTAQQVSYALEGVIVTCGATIEWLKNELGLFTDSKDTEAMAMAVSDNQGVYIVPAFSGLGAPHWDMNRKAAIYGLSFAATKNHIVRAALESIPYQIRDVLSAMEADAQIVLQQLMTDGGITGNHFILQFLSDQLAKKVESSEMPDVSALGAAYMAGLEAGVYTGLEQLQRLNRRRRTFMPAATGKEEVYYKGWQNAIQYGG